MQQKKIGDYQNGFKMNRGTIDDVRILRQIIEKACECGIQTGILFIDFRQAFEST